MKIVIVDDHDIVRSGLANLLESQNRNYEIVAMLESGEKAYHFLSKNDADLVLMDISMNGISGIETARKILKRNKEQKIIILTMHDNPIFINQAFEIGVLGYLSKNKLTTDLSPAIESVRKNIKFISEDFQSVLNYSTDDKLKILTPREFEIFKFFINGNTIDEISAQLSISKKTVSNNLAEVKSKLEISSDFELFKLGIRYKILDQASFGILE
jgi:two-component system invasion response regulator UvrY